MTNRTWVKAAQIGLVIGLLMLVTAVAAVVTRPGKDDTPTCNGRPMLKTDSCITHYSDGSTESRSYDQVKGHFEPVVAGVIAAGGVVLTVGSIWVWRRKREQHFQFAPFHIVEVGVPETRGKRRH